MVEKGRFEKGNISWNKGINCWEGRKHPKGMLGKENKWGNHTIETKEKIRETLKKLYKDKKIQNSNYIDGRSKNCSPARYRNDWLKIRMLIYNRDNFTCQECGITMNETKKPHHIHHIIPFLTNFDNSLDNLITLCPSCHRREEGKIMKKLKNSKMED